MAERPRGVAQQDRPLRAGRHTRPGLAKGQTQARAEYATRQSRSGFWGVGLQAARAESEWLSHARRDDANKPADVYAVRSSFMSWSVGLEAKALIEAMRVARLMPFAASFLPGV